MERRQMLKCLLAGGVSGALAGPAFAQQGAPRPQSPPPRGGTAARPDSNTIVALPAELLAVLQEWEEKTAIITRLRGTHFRFEYDDVFGVEKRSGGEFWHEAPDKARIDFQVPKLPESRIDPDKKTSSGEPYRIEADAPQTWCCDGKVIIQVDHTPKTYGEIEIPPQHQGKNIMDGPLPFLFGMKSEKLQQRYQLGLGSKHDQPGDDGRKKYHIVAAPLLQEDARNWQRAEVLLDAQYCLPSAIRLIDPGGTKETVYYFPLKGMKANEKFWFPDPFKMALRGYKLTEKQIAQPQDTGIPPADKSQPLGRATLRDNPQSTN